MNRVDGHATAAPAATAVAPLELAVVIPTFNEVANLAPIVERLTAALDGLAWEVVFVDDNSPDGTAQALRAMARDDRRIRCVQRIGRRGLASACIEGALATAAPCIAVMDADLQHDAMLLPEMLAALRQEPALDIVVASRFVSGGSAAALSEQRALLSRLGNRLARLVLRAELSDPMSGYFMLRRAAFEAALPRLSGIGFKILLDLFAAAPRPMRYRELPYEFGRRAHGESKLDSRVAWEFGLMLLDKLFGRLLPVRFVAFSIVGTIGIGVHFAVLSLLFQGFGIGFGTAQAAATLAAMTGNFLLNNALTYRDKRLHGWRLLRGWLSFVAVCSVGAVANVGVATYLFALDTGWVLSALAGVLIGAVWNYAVSSVVTWKG